MDARQIDKGVRVSTDIARNISDDLYGYYLTLRGPAPGAMPEGSAAMLTYDERIYHEKVFARVMGWVGYTRPLTLEEVRDYELVPDESNTFVYDRYFVEIQKMVRDASGKRHVTSERVQNIDGSDFVTPYRGKAQMIADEINEAALDTNSSDNITRAIVKKIVG